MVALSHQQQHQHTTITTAIIISNKHQQLHTSTVQRRFNKRIKNQKKDKLFA